MTPDDKAAMRERHRSDMGHLIDGDSGVPVCPTCRRLWPCDTIRALDALDEAERRGDAAITRLNSVRAELSALIAVLRYPDDEVVEAVSAAFARTAAENSDLKFTTDRTFELAWKGEARAAIAAMADALGVES